MAKPKVAVIILNWNGLKDTLECLESVSHSQIKAVELNTYVIDNASSDDSVSTISKQFPQTTLIENKKNLGFSGGNNVGIKLALEENSDFVILLNNDTVVNKNTFSNLFIGAKKHNFDISSPKIYFYPDREFHLKSYKKEERGKVVWYAGGRIDWNNIWPSHIGVDEVDHGQFSKAQKSEFATGCCMLIKKRVFETIGFLDSKYKAYFEDNDFCQRAKNKSFSIGFIPDSIMWHKNAGSTGGPGSRQQQALIEKSRFIFAMRYASLRTKLALLKQRLSKH